MVLTPLLGVRHHQESVPYPCEREQKKWLTEAHRLGLRRGTMATTGVSNAPSACSGGDQRAVTADWGVCALVGVPLSPLEGRGWCVGVVAALPLGFLIS